ncbi:MAG: sugar phosphate nucleotidyltransferase [Candidatus Peribacteraceae bacterium]|jgi:UTP--glucose-1-phosphate uridylyltransferase|nr:sugar phosphate nucleotidyltransferase [Candidatus Peribacteraceae bacterium]
MFVKHLFCCKICILIGKTSDTLGRDMAITQAILPAAGLGTRFLPWTKVVPKEMLPIGNQPIIAKIVDECMDAGILDICFVISKGKECIPEYFYEHPELEAQLEKRGKLEQLEHLKKYAEADFHVVYQDEQHGDGHAILQAADWVNSESIAILFGDDLFTGGASGLQQLIDAHEKLPQEERGAIAALEVIDPKYSNRYGIVDPECDHDSIAGLVAVKGLVEKPDTKDSPSNLGIVGRYIIPKSTIDLLPTIGASHGGEIRLIDALIEQLGTVPVHGLQCDGTRLDTGTPAGYAHAVQLLGAIES